ncbi:MAG: cell division protein FtsL [Pseudomonadota bacterium]
MRTIFYALTVAIVISMAFWAYHENYQTQEAQARTERLQNDIAGARERLRMLRAEWAYLNRPDRLRDLAEINYKSLELMEIRPHQFGRVGEVTMPVEELEIIELPLEELEIIDLRSDGGHFP